MSIKQRQRQATGRVWGRQESGWGPLTTCPVAPWALSAPGASGGILGHPQARKLGELGYWCTEGPWTRASGHGYHSDLFHLTNSYMHIPCNEHC